MSRHAVRKPLARRPVSERESPAARLAVFRSAVLGGHQVQTVGLADTEWRKTAAGDG
jgi:hypothetical protein